jgi:hypothetical protein
MSKKRPRDALAAFSGSNSQKKGKEGDGKGGKGVRLSFSDKVAIIEQYESKKTNQSRLADAYGVSQGTISKIIADAAKLKKLAKSLTKAESEMPNPVTQHH